MPKLLVLSPPAAEQMDSVDTLHLNVELETAPPNVIQKPNAVSTVLRGSKNAHWMFAALNLGFADLQTISAEKDVKQALEDAGLQTAHLVVVVALLQNVPSATTNLGFTHVNFAFAFFDPATFAIAPMDGKTGALYNRFTALKSRGVQTWISVGGWSFTDPGPTRTAFSTMSSSPGNRQKFISGLKQFMDTYGFDGVDLDWEYPQADDRGGSQGDTANYVQLVKGMSSSFGTKYGITVTLPTSYWYLQHFDLVGMQDAVDWFNLMSYDMHGVWDSDSRFVGPYIAPHTNITEIDGGLDLLWRAGVSSSKVVLGQGWYGRSFTLKDGSCNKPNGICQFSGGANAGPCSNAAGILDLQEIKDIISTNNLSPVWDKTAGIKYITWGGNQWVSYDDDDTFKQKRDFANSRCLGGLMVWALDQIDQKSDNKNAASSSVTTDDQKDAKQKSDDMVAGITCYTTDCDAKCKKGTNQVAQMNGQPGSLSTNDRCGKGKYRNLCCDDGTLMGVCQWRGYRGVGLSCMGGCDNGETEIVQDTNHKEKKGDQTCTGGMQSYCCKGFKPAPNGADLVKDAKELAKSAAEALAAQVALDIAAKAFCRIAVPALLAPLELLEDAIPIIGEILDIAEIAATPAIIEGCVKGIEKEGKAEFKVFGKKHTLDMNKPTDKPKESRPPKSSHSSAKTSSECPRQPKHAKRAAGAPAPACNAKKIVTVTTKISDEAPAAVGELACQYSGDIKKNGGQACLHYSSVMSRNPLKNYKRFTCPYSRVPKGDTSRPATSEYIKDRPAGKGWSQPGNWGSGCQRDEWPPALFLTINDGYMGLQGHDPARDVADFIQFVRLLDGGENGRAGQAWNRICPQDTEKRDTKPKDGPERVGADGTTTISRSVEAVYKRKIYTYTFISMPNPLPADWGLGDNRCQPQRVGKDDRGYALLDRDPWWLENAKLFDLRADYKKQYVARRDLLLSDDMAELNMNSTNDSSEEGHSEERSIEQKMMDELGLIKCEDRECSKELAEYGIESAVIAYAPESAKPTGIVATVTVAASPTTVTSDTRAFSRGGFTFADMPRMTPSPLREK
ncbi:uncharacterized protein PAC_16959 [Phialocephala subalpina]|uniref:chitinase n=1 Tax=Phialocephala subalpina TaxID=576137 RepID=A0A1L7XPU1_9HELO|nr:uncharacterized protein PAC_16959 [Phialocephala subalpina]